jgi:hypothetical protein
VTLVCRRSARPERIPPTVDTTDVTKLIVNLTPKSRTALDLSVKHTEVTRADTVNRALQLYWGLLAMQQIPESQGDSFDFKIIVRFDAPPRRWWKLWQR